MEFALSGRYLASLLLPIDSIDHIDIMRDIIEIAGTNLNNLFLTIYSVSTKSMFSAPCGV